MKNQSHRAFALSLLAMTVALGCQESQEVELATVKYEIPNMVCEFSCVPQVEKTLAAQPGVMQVDVDLESKIAAVLVDPVKFDAEKARADLVDVQFVDAKVISTSSNAPLQVTSVAAKN